MALNSSFGHKKISANARGEQRKCDFNAERREQEKSLFATPQKDELVSSVMCGLGTLKPRIVHKYAEECGF